jgi:hypothetical protein
MQRKVIQGFFSPSSGSSLLLGLAVNNPSNHSKVKSSVFSIFRKYENLMMTKRVRCMLDIGVLHL